MKLRKKFSDEDLGRIRAAVKQAEDKISGEIVPVIVECSDDYDQARYKSSLIFGAVSFITMILLDRYVIDASHTLFYDPMFIFFIVTVFSLMGYFLPDFFSPLKRFFLSQAVMDESTRQKAETCFLEEEVFNTKQRTGIMIFISFFEHEVIIMADKGISKVVEQKEWDAMVSNLIAFIRQGKVVEGLEQGIRKCGDILLEKGFHKASDDTNELRDDLRIN